MPRGRPRKVVSETLSKINELDNMIAEEDDTVSEEYEKTPDQSSPEWNSYVLSLLSDDEFDERVVGIKLPKTDGLGRIVRLIYGEILVSEPDYINIIGETVIVRHKLVVRSLHTNDLISISGLADATPENTDPPYNKFLLPVAHTRARGRAYRDLLGLKNVSVAEELSEKAECDVMITSSQKAAIKNLCSQLNIDHMKFVCEEDERHISLDTVSRNVAARLLSKLHDYKHGKEEIRVDILKGE